MSEEIIEYKDKIKGQNICEVIERIDDKLEDITAGIPEDGSITDTKMATDVKVGSLAALTTTAKTSIQAAINEIDGHADTALGRVATNQAIYAGTDHTALATAFNALLLKLKTAGLMTAD